MTVRNKRINTKKAIDMDKVREGDELLRRARELNPDVRMPDMDELQEIAKKGPGRPKGPEETVTIAIRIPVSLRERLDRHLDRLEVRHGIKSNRASMCRHALVRYLNEGDN